MSEQSQCTKCQQVLNRSEFYSRPNGRLETRCKECVKAASRRYHWANREKCIAGAKQWRLQNPERKKANDARWRAANVERKRVNDARLYYRDRAARIKSSVEYKRLHPEIRKKADKRYNEKHPERRRAHEVVAIALRSGKLKRQPCEVCGKRAQSHHDDYAKPLCVRWLCSTHHAEHHLKEKGGSVMLARLAKAHEPEVLA